MLFSTIDQAILTELTATQNLIDELEAQLVIARDRRSQLEQEIQAQKAAKSAAESAIQQAKVARQLLRAAYGEDAIEEFNFELTLDEVQRDVITPADLEVDEVESRPTPVEPESEIEVEAEAIEVAAVEVEVEPQPQIETQEEVIDESPTELEPEVVSAQVLHRQKAKSLQWLATQKGIETQDMKRHELAKLLQGKVTQVELNRAILQAS